MGKAARSKKHQEAPAKPKTKLKDGNLRQKGENFYRTGARVKQLNMLKEGRATRNARGEIIKPASFLNDKPDAAVARIQPDRRWFGNTRVVGQGELERFRQEVAQASNDPYRVLLRQNKLPMSLLHETGKDRQLHLLQAESFAYTFGGKAQRRKPKLSHASLEEMVARLEENDEPVTEAVKEQLADAPLDPVMLKGKSRRIWNELYKVLDSSDVVVHVLDARNPLGTRCAQVETFLQNEAPHKHLIYCLNKCDLVPSAVAARWVKYLARLRPTIAFHASMNNPFGKGSLINLLRQFSRLHRDKKQISVGFIGYPNTGKSSIINALRKKAVCSVAPIPGQTKVWQYVTLMKRIYLIDCPGVVPVSPDDTPTDTILKGVVRVENISAPEDHIAELLRRADPLHLQRTYEITGGWEDHIDFLTRLAMKMGKLLRGGEADLGCVAKMVLNDWIRGKIPYHTDIPHFDKEDNEEKEDDDDDDEQRGLDDATLEEGSEDSDGSEGDDSQQE